MRSVLVLCAHNDDQIIGAGGTLAKYSREGIKVVTVIFSYGMLSHPHLQKKVIIETRVRESLAGNKVMCGPDSEVYYLGLSEGRFDAEIQQKKISTRIRRMIRQYKPEKIFTHSLDDPHPDHRAVYRFVTSLAEKMKFRGDIYSFNVWNFFFNLRNRQLPRLIVDISDTMRYKVEAFRKHKSQWIVQLQFMWSVYAQAILNGLIYRYKYAEVFFKIR